MKKYTSLALIGAIVAGITGFVSLDAISATSLMTMQGTSDIHETGLMIGHVTYEVRGMDGQIKHYLQADNVIVDKGTDCSAQVIFNGAGSDVCTLGSSGGFAYIAIGNATGATAQATDTALDTSANGGEVKRSGFIDATITAANSGSNLDTVVSIASTPFTFTELTSGTSITQSGLFDQGTLGGNMFSIRDIPGPTGTGGLPVTSTDTLSVTWTITLT